MYEYSSHKPQPMSLNGKRCLVYQFLFEMKRDPDVPLYSYWERDPIKFITPHIESNLEFSYSKDTEAFKVWWRFLPLPNKDGNFGYVTSRSENPGVYEYTFDEARFLDTWAVNPDGEMLDLTKLNFGLPVILERGTLQIDSTELPAVVCINRSLAYNPRKDVIKFHTPYGIVKTHRKHFTKYDPSRRFFG